MKPENVLLDSQGYIRITDFGLSKMGVKTAKEAKSVCGTPEYLAPEILFKLGHGKPVDWWTLGAILYEMITGLPPFYTTNREELFERIKFGQLKFPAYITSNCRNIMENLFQKNPEKRLGAHGAKDVKSHPWFANVNWKALLNKEVKPPFIPVIKFPMDVGNFADEFIEEPIDSFQDKFSIESVHNNYLNFSYNGEAKEIIKGQVSQEKGEVEQI